MNNWSYLKLKVMLNFWGPNSLKWTKVSETCENKDRGLLPGAVCAVGPYSAILAFHLHLGFFSMLLGYLYSRLLPLPPVPPVHDEHQDAVFDWAVLCWSTSLTGSTEYCPECSPIADITWWWCTPSLSSFKLFQVADFLKLLRMPLRKSEN